jgi:hypothetical protein
MSEQRQGESEFDLDATEQELLDEFGLLVAAEYYYRTMPAHADSQGRVSALSQRAAIPSLDQRFAAALQKQRDLLKE